MSDAQASSLVALFLAGTALGGLLGGAVGDAAAARWPAHGRIAVTQARGRAGQGSRAGARGTRQGRGGDGLPQRG